MNSQRTYAPNASSDVDVAIIGAGPYGLSAAAHLKTAGYSIRVFGQPMSFWADNMPKGMLLRSPRVASNISDPEATHTLDAFEAATGKAPAAPVPLETFVDYGRWFRDRLGSDLDKTQVVEVNRQNSGYDLTLQNGTTIHSRRVVVAAGIGPFRKVPSVFAGLPPEQASHCYEGRPLEAQAGRRVAVIGAGQSALECAALLNEAGADVEIIARIPALRWIGKHSWLHNLGPISNMLYSSHDVGPAGISRLVASPNLVSCFPLTLRDRIRTRAVRSAGSKWLPARLTRVKITPGRSVTAARSSSPGITLKLDDGTERRVDYVLLGTGYRVDVSQYAFLSRRLLADIAQFDGYPCLTGGFSSSAPGLHFIGAPAARTFGPLLYFVAGTDFSSKELLRHIRRNR